MTRVYRARPAEARDAPAAYAVKLLREELENDPRAVALLRREALVGKTVAHPHLVSVLASCTSQPPYFLVMPWLEGTSLAEVLARCRRLEARTAFWIARQTAEALAALSANTWMHGDVKPENLIVSPEGHVTLVDLGFARRTDQREAVDGDALMGTCAYMAPEAISSLRTDSRSDLYSLGVMLFEMLAGRRPFESDDPEELSARHRGAKPPELGDFVAGLSPDACRLVRELLAKEPLRRPQAGEVVARLIGLEIAALSFS